MSIKVSIIIPVYNSEKYLEKCLKSVINQSYKNFEIILVDDGSTDKSDVLCDKYASEHEKIRIYHQNNKGQNPARITGIRMADSDFVMFIDSDDWIEKDYIENMVMKLDDEVDMVSSGLIIDNENGSNYEIRMDGVPEGIYAEDVIKSDIMGGFLFSNVKGYPIINHSLCNKLIRRELALLAIEGVDARITLGEDGAAMLFVLLNSRKIYVMHYAGYHYVQHMESTLHSFGTQELWRLDILQEFLIKQLKSNGLYNSRILDSLASYMRLNGIMALKKSYNYREYDALKIPDKLPEKCESVIVYGAGKRGREFVKDLEEFGKYNIVAWADKNYKELCGNDLELISPGQIMSHSFDYVFIAIVDRCIAKSVEVELVNAGVPVEKIWILDTVKRCIAE